MPYQVFVDESGGKEQGRYFVMAGLMSHAEDWAKFSDEWAACLAAEPRIKYFKMKEAAGRNGEFHKFTKDERDAKLLALAQIINRHVDAAIFIGMEVEGFLATFAKMDTLDPMKQLYFWPFYFMNMGVCFDLWETGLRERFEITFDAHDMYAKGTHKFYEMAREILQGTDPEASSILPVDPIFRDDKEFLPLQAADLFAWCYRKADQVNPSDSHPFHWLLAELRSVSMSKFCQVIDMDRMERIKADVQKRIRSGNFNKVLAQKYKDTLND